MVKEVTKYEAKDGCIFDTFEEANSYETNILLANTLADFIYDSCTDVPSFYYPDAFSLAKTLLENFDINKKEK